MSSAISFPSSQNTSPSVPVSSQAAVKRNVTQQAGNSCEPGRKPEKVADQPQAIAEQELLDQLYVDYWSL